MLKESFLIQFFSRPVFFWRSFRRFFASGKVCSMGSEVIIYGNESNESFSGKKFREIFIFLPLNNLEVLLQDFSFVRNHRWGM